MWLHACRGAIFLCCNVAILGLAADVAPCLRYKAKPMLVAGDGVILVIECVDEVLSLKHKVIAEVCRLIKGDHGHVLVALWIWRPCSCFDVPMTS